MAIQLNRDPSDALRATVTVLMAACLLLSVPVVRVGAATGDLLAPVYNDGDWWNYTVRGPHQLPVTVGDYSVSLNWSTGQLRYTVSGVEGRLGQVAWRMAVSGALRLTGKATGPGGASDAYIDAAVSGLEWRSVSDLSLLGSSMSFTGRLQISSMSGPIEQNLTEWENVSLSAPMRMLTFPIPLTHFPKERHVVDVTRTYEASGFSAKRVENWNFTDEYKGLTDVQGSAILFANQHQFKIAGNVTADSKRSRFDGSLYFDALSRKAVSIDGIQGLEANDYFVDVATVEPDLVVIDDELHASNLTPRQGTDVTFSAIIHNVGIVDVDMVRVELWGSLKGGLPSEVNSTVVDRIIANSKVTVKMNWTSTILGGWDFLVRVDPFGYIPEARKDNNEASISITVVQLVTLPNLYVSSEDLTLDPPSPVNNRTAVHVTISVFNLGPGTARNATVDWFLGAPFAGGTPIGWRNVLEIVPAGRSALAWINWVADVPGDHELYAVVDINNSINETTETDNIAHVPVIVIASPFGGVDLVVVKVKVVDSLGQEATQLPVKERASVQVLIDNVESRNATRVHLDVFIDVENPAGLIGSYEGQIGAHQPVWWTVPWTVAGSERNHTIIAKVLAIGQDEATFLDNERSIRFTIGPRSTPPPETLLISMYPDTTLPTSGSRLTVSGKVTKMSNGVDVPDATITISFNGTAIKNTTTTNLIGRYVVSIAVPPRAQLYKLTVEVAQGYNTGSTYVNIDVQSPVVPPKKNETKPGSGIFSTNFAIIVVVLVVVVAPVSFLAFKAVQVRRARIKKVHEEVLEIVEEKK